MSKWNVYGAITATKYMGTVEAATKKEALEMAWGLDTHVRICHHCAKEIDDAEIQDIEVEEENG